MSLLPPLLADVEPFHMTNKHPMPPIAIVGIGALFSGRKRVRWFWRTIMGGRDCMSEVPAGHWLIADYYDPDPAAPGKTYARRGAFLSPVDFDPIEHGIPPNTASCQPIPRSCWLWSSQNGYSKTAVVSTAWTRTALP